MYPVVSTYTYFKGLILHKLLTFNFEIWYVAAPEIIVRPNHKTVLIGEQLKLTCEAIGTPKPSITWTKDDIIIEPSDRIQV